jgi:hypothetical protein
MSKMYNRLYVVPTDDTMGYLSALMSGSPVDVDLETLKIELITTEDELEIDPERVYSVEAISVGVFYDTYLQRSNLIVTFKSSDMQTRYRELRDEGVVRAFYGDGIPYIPYMALIRGTPPMTKHFRAFKLAVTNALVANERMLTFTGEHVEVEKLMAVPDYDYIDAMKGDLVLRHSL